ncbi:MAG: type III-A CRISPR-associated protein Cas10/Csm1 [Methanobacteriaceae archaeon]|nr:type III-A CRISPR-associated protein Cas10/Csm1 [Methanobacteriaceae archaeon]
MSLEKLQLAALLHDIGKFYQRTGIPHHNDYKNLSREDFGQNGAHGKWSATFTSKYGLGETIDDLVLHHHIPKNAQDPLMAKILQKADHHSSKERIKTGETQNVKKEPLISVFSKVKLDKNNNPSEYYLPLQELDPSNMGKIKPEINKESVRSGWNLEPNYLRLWKSFEKEMSLLTKKDDFDTLYYILKKYTSLMPSAAYLDHPDISLFDHLKTTAALATCLYHYAQENDSKFSDNKNTYLIVNGDISGIQKFIYRISSPQEAQKGMSKRLRGRSFYLNLLSDAIVNRIINELELSPANILFCGGGQFILILPNTSKSEEILDSLYQEINSLFISKFNADLYMALSKVECSGNDLEDFGSLMNELSFENQKNKRSRFRDYLPEIFADEEKVTYKTCPVCGLSFETNNNFCPDCSGQADLGTKISNANYIIRVVNPSQKADFKVLNVGYYFENNKNSLIQKIKVLNSENHKIEVLKLNDSNYKDLYSEIKEMENISLGFAVLGNTVPRHPHKGTLYFNHLAEISQGSNKLGILKMDVDNLGQVFSRGLETRSISRISTMSSFMDLFFSGHINSIAEEFRVLEHICPSCEDSVKFKKVKILFGEENTPVELYKEINGKVCSECTKTAIPTIYITYSGGDDLLVLGPYDDIIQFSQRLRDEFKDWTCNNKEINISGGIFLGGPKFPAERGVKFADDSLETSKNCGKDMLTLFNETVRWNTAGIFKGFDEILNYSIKLENLLREGKISKNMVYSMMVMWQNTFTSLDKHPARNELEWNKQNKIRLERKRYVPQFKYKLRTVKNRDVREELDKEGLKFIPWIKIPASWVSLRSR